MDIFYSLNKKFCFVFVLNKKFTLFFLQLKNLMVVGIDTYHDSAKKGRSVAGYVASMNKSLTRYYSRVAFQHNHQELLDGLVVCTKGIINVVLTRVD